MMACYGSPQTQGQGRLVDLLFLINAVFTGTAVDEQQETANNGEDLEEVVLGKILVRVVGMELSSLSAWFSNVLANVSELARETNQYLQSRSC